MAKKSVVQRQKKREKLVLRYKSKRENLLNELKTTSSFSETLELQKKLQKLPLNSAKNRLRNRCWKTAVVVHFTVILGYAAMFYEKWHMKVYCQVLLNQVGSIYYRESKL